MGSERKEKKKSRKRSSSPSSSEGSLLYIYNFVIFCFFSRESGSEKENLIDIICFLWWVLNKLKNPPQSFHVALLTNNKFVILCSTRDQTRNLFVFLHFLNNQTEPGIDIVSFFLWVPSSVETRLNYVSGLIRRKIVWFVRSLRFQTKDGIAMLFLNSSLIWNCVDEGGRRKRQRSDEEEGDGRRSRKSDKKEKRKDKKSHRHHSDKGIVYTILVSVFFMFLKHDIYFMLLLGTDITNIHYLREEV